MKTQHLILVALFFVSSISIGQRLSLSDLHSISSATNWEQVNQSLMKKGWEYYESSRGDSQRYNTITWSYNRSFEDKAEGWFYVYTVDKIPNKVSYTTFNKPSYTSIQKSLASNGYELVDSEIKDNAITSTYQNKDYIIDITTDKREGSSSFDESITGYRFVVVKRQGAFDYDNGTKVDYHSNGNISMEYELKNGKIHGPIKVYHENGQLKKTGTYLDGQQNGLFTEYDQYGNKLYEYSLKQDKKYGQLIFYENGEKSTSTTFRNDIKNGEYIEYYYNDIGELTLKNMGQFENDRKEGEWKLNYVGDGENKIIQRTNFKNGEKDGPFQDFKGDSLIVGNYSKDVLHGPYKVFLDVKKFIIGGLITTDTTKLQKLIVGQYKNGHKTGYWKYYDITQTLYSEGSYINDKKSGEWKNYYTKFATEDNQEEPYSQKLYLVENYKNGELDGEVKRLSYLNREEKPCPPEVEKEDGCWELIYYKVKEVSNYRQGKLHGPYSFENNESTFSQIGNYTNGEKHGEWTITTRYIVADDYVYLKENGSFIYGKKNGLWFEYMNNKLWRSTNYVNGTLDGDHFIMENEKPSQKRIFDEGKLKTFIVYDSTGVSEVDRFELLKHDHYGSLWKRKNPIGSLTMTQEYRVKPEVDTDDPSFEFVLRNEENMENNSYNTYRDGKFEMLESNTVQIEGYYNQNSETGRWTYYFYDQGVKMKSDFIDGKKQSEFYFTLNNDLYSGKFVFIDEAEGVIQEIKIKNSLRHGKTIFKDSATGKTIKKEKYKKGILQ